MAEEVAPMVYYLARRKRVLKTATSENPPIPPDNLTSLEEEDLRSLIETDRARVAAMDEKTFKLSLSLTVALTILGTLSPLLLDRFTATLPKIICAVLIALTAIYALSSGFISLGAMRTLPTYGFGWLDLPKAAIAARKQLLAESLLRNEKVGIARHLRNETSYQLLRNGLICLSAALTIYAAAVITGNATITLQSSLTASNTVLPTSRTDHRAYALPQISPSSQNFCLAQPGIQFYIDNDEK